MGQGTYTKIAQLAAAELGLPLNKIKVSATTTDKVPNTSASAASSTTDLNGAAMLDAIAKIKRNLFLFVKRKYKIKNEEAIYENGLVKFRGKSFKFNKLIKEAYLNRVSLSSSGFYTTPKIRFDPKKFYGRPFLYFCYGAAVSEVIIDTLTGENKILRVDILHDAGQAINPAIELGQIEGGFLQGAGWLTMDPHAHHGHENRAGCFWLLWRTLSFSLSFWGILPYWMTCFYQTGVVVCSLGVQILLCFFSHQNSG